MQQNHYHSPHPTSPAGGGEFSSSSPHSSPRSNGPALHSPAAYLLSGHAPSHQPLLPPAASLLSPPAYTPSSPSPSHNLMSASSSPAAASPISPAAASAAPSPCAPLPASVRAILEDSDLAVLASSLNMQLERLVTCLKSEGNLAYLKVSDLKSVIGFLKNKLKKNIKISGNKSDLTQRIAEELFYSSTSRMDDGASGPTQTTLSGYGMQNTAYEAPPPAKRARTTAPAPSSTITSTAQSSTNYNKLVAMPHNSPSNLYMQPSAPTPYVPATSRSTTQQLYNEVAFQQQQSPLYRVLKQLSVVSFGLKTSRVAVDRAQLMRHVFTLDAPTIQELQGPNPRKWAVHIRFFSTLKNADIMLGYDANLRLNGKPVDVTKSYKKIRSKNIQNPFITPSPADVTTLVGASNLLEFTVQKNVSGVAVVQLIQEVSAEDVLPSITRSSPEYKRPATSTGDLEETKVLVSLRCPLGYCRIEYPARGVRCNHLQCFDVRFYLQFCHQQRLWHCPVCNGPIPFHELVIDEYFNSILNAMDSETMKAEIHPDGTFTKPDTSEKKQRLAGSKRKEVGVQEIDLEAIRHRELDDLAAASAASLSAESSTGADASAGAGTELILRPVRVERTSDDEDDGVDPDRTSHSHNHHDDYDDSEEDDYARDSGSAGGDLGSGGGGGFDDGDDDHEGVVVSRRSPSLSGSTGSLNSSQSPQLQQPPAHIYLIDDLQPAPAPRSLSSSSASLSQSGGGGGTSELDTIVID